MSAFTAKSYQFDKAPKRISLLGNKKKPESAQHIIEFPGGAVEVSRTEDGRYWAHIIVNRKSEIDDCDGLMGAVGTIEGSRIDYEWPANPNVIEIPNQNGVQQIAVLIGRK